MAHEYTPLDVFYQTYGNPLFETPFGKKYLIHADSTASGQPHRHVEKYIQKQLLPLYNNTHSNAYSGQLMSHYIDESKKLIHKLLNIDKNYAIVFTGNGCTGAINHFVHCLGICNYHRHDFYEGKKIVIFNSVLEHHSNMLPWYHLENCDYEIINITCDGLIDLTHLEQKLKEYSSKDYQIFCSFTACSNVTGVIQEVEKISKLVHLFGGIIFFDYACSAPYVNINMQINMSNGNYIDAIYFSPHKFMGGTQTPGVLIAKRCLFKNDEPFYKGGGTTRFVCSKFCKYSDEIEIRETGGTPNILGCIKVGLTLQLKEGYKNLIEKREIEIVNKVKPELATIPNLILLNPKNNKHQLPIFSFMVKDVHYNLIVVLLNDLFGIQTRGGISCCSFYAQHLLNMCDKDKETTFEQIVSGHGVPQKYGWCRVSFHYSMPDYIVDYIIMAIKYVADVAKLLEPLYDYDEIKNNWIMKGFKSPIESEKINLFSSVDGDIKNKYVSEEYCRKIFENINSEMGKVLSNYM